jgi:23S rRNA (adenine-N6)-dimethyltransferase
LEASWADRLVADAAVGPGELVLDIGAGAGALTAPLVRAGARVIAVELHPRRARLLRESFPNGAVRVVVADGADLKLPRRPFRVVANPPFGVSVALVRRLLAPGSRLVRADLVLPHHIARRWLRGDAPGAGRWREAFTVRLGGRVPRHAFQPVAPRDATVLVIERAQARGRAPAGAPWRSNGNCSNQPRNASS